MSVLIAIKDKTRIVVGVDVRSTSDQTYFDSYSRRPKAIHIDDKRNIIVGAVGNCSLVDVTKEILDQYEEQALLGMDKSTIVKYILPELISKVNDYELMDNYRKMDGELLIAVKDRAYSIAGNYSVGEVQDYYAIGSGRETALGSLYTSSKILSIAPEEKIKIAIEAAGNCINSVSKLSYIGDTAGKCFSPANLKTPQKH